MSVRRVAADILNRLTEPIFPRLRRHLEAQPGPPHLTESDYIGIAAVIRAKFIQLEGLSPRHQIEITKFHFGTNGEIYIIFAVGLQGQVNLVDGGQHSLGSTLEPVFTVDKMDDQELISKLEAALTEAVEAIRAAGYQASILPVDRVTQSKIRLIPAHGHRRSRYEEDETVEVAHLMRILVRAKPATR